MAHPPPFVGEFYRKMLDYGQLKPQRAVGEVSAFPGDRVKELFDVVTSATELPSFEEVLKVHCGGSLEQICSFCANRVKIGAALGLGTGSLDDVAVVCVKPFLPLLFCCSAMSCLEALAGKTSGKWGDFAVGVNLTFGKLTPSNQCDHCFKLSDDVHRYINSCKLNEESRNDFTSFVICRCSRCLTKAWCSKECQKLGWEAGHKKFCSKEVEERKKKGNIEQRWAEGANYLDNT